VAAHQLGLNVERVIVDHERAETMLVDDLSTYSFSVMAMAARALEEFLELDNGSDGDYQTALKFARGDHAMVDRALIDARRLVRMYLPEIQRIAAVLETRIELSGAELARLLPPPPATRAAPLSSPRSNDLPIHDFATHNLIGFVRRVGEGFMAVTPWGNSHAVTSQAEAERLVREIVARAGIQYRGDGGRLEPIITEIFDEDGEKTEGYDKWIRARRHSARAGA
jgi:hypothetical protein